ncbi:MAG: TOBE domain-containing protein [Leptothrix sp. (in: b-proteobacteria)]
MVTSRHPAASAPLLKGRIALETPLGAVLSDSRIRLLEAIERSGSLNRAAREVPLSYKAAWDALDTMNNLAPEPLVERSTGGSGGGGTRLTDYARRLIALYRAMESAQQDILDRLEHVPAEADAPALRTLLRRLAMKTSARNQLPVRVSGLSDRGGLVDVTLALGDGPGDSAVDDSSASTRLIATITPESAETMELRLGSELFALIKAPAVQIATRPPPAQAGSNALAGRIATLRPGQTHTGVTLTLSSGHSLHAVTEKAQAADFAEGQTTWAVFSGDQIVLVAFG